MALSHALIPGLRRPPATVATLVPAVDFEAEEESPTDLVVLGVVLLQLPAITSGHLARSPGESGIHVRILLPAAECRESMYVLVVFGIAASRLKSSRLRDLTFFRTCIDTGSC